MLKLSLENTGIKEEEILKYAEQVKNIHNEIQMMKTNF